MLCSIVIPSRNEEKFIGHCIESVIAQGFPKNELELLIVDGMSQDTTRDIVQKYAQQYPFIKLLENPQQITPCALNIGIKAAQGEIIIRMDAHATYNPDYISKCLQHLQESKADNVGGTMITLPRENTFMGQLIVAVLTSRFGVGNSDFRTGTKQPKETDTVFGGCYHRKIFDRVGLFNEKLPSSQDMEFNLRLKKQGGRIMLFPDVVSYYYTRSDLRSFCRNNFRNGVWAVMPIKYSEIIPVSWRHFIPLFFVISVLVSGMLIFVNRNLSWILVFIVSLYLAVALYFSSKTALNKKDWKYVVVLPFMYLSLHVLYGLGSFWALLQCLVSVDFWKNAIKISHPQKV